MREQGRASSASMIFLAAVVVLSLSPAPSPGAARDDPSGVLNFEACGAAGSLAPWNGAPAGPAGTTHLDSTNIHGGRFSGRLERRGDSPGEFSSIALSLPVDFAGDSVELRGWLKLEGVRGWAGLWQRQDGRAPELPFDNMESRGLSGSSDWREYSVTLPLDSRARRLVVGALLVGEGTIWVDDLGLRIDGRPLLDAPERIARTRAIGLDHEFDAGSRVSIGTPSPLQIESLVRLGKIWGFLKYHHPAIVSGTRHWDYDLFRILPPLLVARDGVAAEKTLLGWIDGLGAVAPCDPCAAPPADGPIRPRLEWLDDTRFAGPALRDRLRRIHANRLAAPEQTYVGLAPGVGNPDFGDEAPYPAEAAPDEGYRLLALYRFWNIIEYWFPYRDLLEENWDRVLREFVPRILEARSRDEYVLELIALSARVHDGHANLHASLHVRPPRGDCRLPVALRPVGDRFVVAHPADSAGAAEGALKRGDILVALEGRLVDSLATAWTPLYAASNEAARRRDVARFLGRGDCDSVRLTVERAGHLLELPLRRVPSKAPGAGAMAIHDHRGAAFRRLSKDLAYVTLSEAKVGEMADHVRQAAGAKCLVIDIRNYPSEFVVFALGPLLVGEETPFVRFTRCDPANPGAFAWTTEPLHLTPAEPRYEGRVAILVDEATQSSAEYHAMAFRTAPKAVVVGSTTAGADGNVSPIPLPGGLRGMISGIGVYYPDRRPTQRVGILPDLRVLPTVEGIREGRDEVLEAAVRHLLGREMTAEERRALAPDDVR